MFSKHADTTNDAHAVFIKPCEFNIPAAEQERFHSADRPAMASVGL